MRMMMTRGHIIILFMISSFLFLNSSSAAAISLPKFSASAVKQFLKNIAKEIFSPDNVITTLFDVVHSNSSDGEERSSNNLTPEQLRTALENFQRAYGLNVTGKIDDATVSFINRPRCGVPDNSTVSSLRWPWPEEKKNLTYAFYNGEKVKAPLKAVFSRAFARWENITGLSFNETASFNGSDIGIVFLEMNKTDVVAVSSFGKTRRGMFFEVDEEWGPLTGSMEGGEVDFETAVMHQIGHMVG